MIEVKNLTKTYGKGRGVTDISFQVADKEIVGLLGPNGAGKSTIMKMITGYISPTSGTVTVGGCDLLEQPREVAAKIGFMAEIPPLYIDMDVWSYLQFVSEIKGVKRAERKEEIERVLKLTHTDEVKKRLIRNLSKGYRQRVGMAQSLIGSPPVLILDEPTAGLDPKQITEVRNLIKGLSQEHTIMVSSHILAEIDQTCDRVIILKEGKLVAQGTMKELAEGGAGASRFMLRARGKADKLKGLLEKAQGVKGVSVSSASSSQTDFSTLIVETDGGSQVRAGVSALLAEKQIPIDEMRSLGGSLEEIFLELTGGDGTKGEE